jgi:hypothetical protein
MKNIIILIVLTLSSTILSGQYMPYSKTTRPSNCLALNILGNGSMISVSYESVFMDSEDFLMIANIGMGFNQEFNIHVFGPSGKPLPYITLQHSITANIGKGKNFLELGLGGTVVIGNTKRHYYFYPILGYRFHPLKARNINFRIFGSLPITGLKNDGFLFIPFGLSVGYCF